MRAIRCLVNICTPVVALSVLASPSSAGEYYRGYAYTVDDHKMLYQEQHWLYDEKGVGHRLVIYSCANGEPFGRKFVDTAPGEATPDVDMFDSRVGYREGVRTKDGQRQVFTQPDSKSQEKHAPITTPKDAVIDAGFDAFVRLHWDALSTAGVSPLPFLIPSDLKYVDFSAKKLRDEAADGREVRWFRLQLAGWYAFVLPHIDVAYDSMTHNLFEYRGLSNIRGEGNKNLTVTIQFPPAERRANVSPEEVQKAAGMPLTGHCAST